MISQSNQQHKYPFNYHYNKRQPKKRSGQSIQCVLCNAVSPLDPSAGLNSLRRRKKRKIEQRQEKCSEHNEDFQLFCLEDVQLVCFMCAAAKHSRHNLEALDVAQHKLKAEFSTHMNTLEMKRKKSETFVNTLNTDKQKLSTAAENAQRDAKAKIAQLRKLLDEKEKEIEESIKRMESTKANSLTSELNKAQQKMDTIDESVANIQAALCETSPLQFLQKVEDVEEQVRHSRLAADPEVKQKWFQMPSLNTLRLEQLIKSIKYKEGVVHSQYGMPFSEPYDEDEDVHSSEEEEY